MTTDTQTPSTEPAADPTPANVQPVDVELEYKHDHHISGSAEYPVEEALHAKTEENLVPGLWRVYVFRKHPDPITVNCITLKGVNTEHEMPSNLDAEELERAILSVCHRNASERGTRCGFLVRYCHKMPPGQRSKKREVSFELSPSASRPSTERAPSPADSMPAQERWNRQADAWEASATGHGSSGTPFQDTHSPFARHDPPSSWRDNFPPSSGDPARRYDPDDEASRNYQHALANRRRHMFSGDMLPFRPDQMSGDAQKTYMDSILPFQIVNNANNLAYQAFAAAFDMMSSASHETQRLHSIQTAQMLDERKQLMEMLMHQNRVEVENREYRSQQQREGHQAYLEALRLRGDQAQRELAYERTSMHNQFQIGEAQRMLFEQQEKHKNEQTDTFRREIARSLPTAALQGLGLFLDYFGQQKLGAGARAAGTVVGDLLSHATGRGGPQGGQAGPPPGFQAGPPPGFQAGPHAPPRPTPRPTPPPIVDADAPRPSIPRRTIRIRDVATDEEISTSPVRSLCRMVDLAFSQADRERMQSILLPDEWGSLERALRETTDQACVTGLAGVMLSIARDEQRKVAMLSALSPGQRELFEKIGAFIKGQGQLDPSYEVVVRSPVSRMRTVVQDAATVPVPPPDLDAPSAHRVPVPPPDLDVPRPSSRAQAPTPDVVEDVPRPSRRDHGPAAPAAPAAPGEPDTAPAPSTESQILAQLQAMSAQLAQVQQETAQTTQALRAEIEDLRGQTKVGQGDEPSVPNVSEAVTTKPPRAPRKKATRSKRKPEKTA